MVKWVLLSDLENAAHLPNGRSLKGMPAGSDTWRSIEAHLKGELGKPSDMFSFGLVVCIRVKLSTESSRANDSSATTPCTTKWSADTTKTMRTSFPKARSP